MRAVPATLLCSISLVACATFAQRQAALVSHYVARHPGLRPDKREALQSGVVVPGMTNEEFFVATGVRANGYRGYSIWVVTPDGLLRPPPIVVSPGTRVALCTANPAQFKSAEPQAFLVYFDDAGTVARVEGAPCPPR